MNWVDLAVIGIFVVSALLAFLRGFIREALGIGAWIGAVFVAMWAFPYLQARFEGWIDNPKLADPAAYAAAFLVALIFLSVVAGMVGGIVRGSLLGGIDRTLGIAFGLVRGAVLVAVAYIGLGLVVQPEHWPPVLQQAHATPYAYAGADWLVRFLPETYRPAVRPPTAAPESRAEDLLQPPAQGGATAQP